MAKHRGVSSQTHEVRVGLQPWWTCEYAAIGESRIHIISPLFGP